METKTRIFARTKTRGPSKTRIMAPMTLYMLKIFKTQE
jgi:hypothetical protein